jgi:hypothetical protein
VTLVLQISWLAATINFVAGLFMAEGQTWA